VLDAHLRKEESNRKELHLSLTLRGAEDKANRVSNYAISDLDAWAVDFNPQISIFLLIHTDPT
jgi:hypothetical protein